MDTTLIMSNKRLLNAVGIAMNISVIALFAFTQSVFLPILANDVLANLSNPVLETNQMQIRIMNEVSTESRYKNFNEQAERKYKRGIITNIDRGIKHIKLTKYYDGKPVRINVVEIDRKLAKDYTLTPVLAADKLNNKRTITTIAQNSNSIVAINGTFFKPQTGVPLGTLMIDKKLYTGPVYDRVAMGIFDDGFDMARTTLNAKLITNNKEIIINNINQPRMLSDYILCYTADWGRFAPPNPKYGIQVQIKDNIITAINRDKPTIIPDTGYVIVGPQSKLGSLKVGERIKVDYRTTPEWRDVRHIISGGPYLVKDGKIFVDMTAQKLNSIGGKNPRSAIGYTNDGTLVMVAVDGREGGSVGMTLMQLAQFMQSIGCINAMNLDGGGSTVMYVNGKVVNNPQQKGGIAISNAIVLQKRS